MDVDRKTVAELALSAVVLAVFVGATFVVSDRFATPRDPAGNGSIPPVLDPQGGLAIVGIVAVFVVLLGLVGLWMYYMDFED